MLAHVASGSSGQSGPCNVLGGSEVRIHLGQCNRLRRPSHFLDSLLGSAGHARRKFGWTNSSINSSDRSSCFSHSCGRRRGGLNEWKATCNQTRNKDACMRWMFCNTTQCPSRAHLLMALIATSCVVKCEKSVCKGWCCTGVHAYVAA